MQYIPIMPGQWTTIIFSILIIYNKMNHKTRTEEETQK